MIVCPVLAIKGHLDFRIYAGRIHRINGVMTSMIFAPCLDLAHFQQVEMCIRDRSFSMVDVIFGSILGWAQMMNLLEGFEHVRAYFKRVCVRPAFERAVS